MQDRLKLRALPSPAFLILCGLLSILWIAGGGSRADLLGQVIVRAATWGFVIIAIFAGVRPAPGSVRSALLIVAGAMILSLAQLVPLPPALWQSLPGRGGLAGVAALVGEPQPWRPLAIVPGAALNAAASLVVPIGVLLLVSSLNRTERTWLPSLLLVVVTASMVAGLLQFSGRGLNNVFVNDTPGEVSGTFANRNHFALFLALGCVIAPVWAFLGDRRRTWRAPAALGLVVLFELTILASGSRAGMLAGAIALVVGLSFARRGIRRALAGSPRWMFPAIITGVVGVLTVFILLSIVANRAVSFDRAFALDAGQDMRSRGLPTVLNMIRIYLPWGSGLGGFDPMFRMHEPFALLKRTYFNHAHNDFLEIALDAGLPGILLLATAIGWWAWSSILVWRGKPGTSISLGRLGSAIIFLVFAASLVDYPARTPLIMATLAIAGAWLNLAREAEIPSPSSALPRTREHL